MLFWAKRAPNSENDSSEDTEVDNRVAEKNTIDVKYIWNNSYIWTAVVDQSEEWPSQ